MAKEICTVCGREIDSRGMSGHMKTHKAEPEGEDNGVISYPSNEQKIEDETQIKQPVLQNIPKKPVKKSVKKTVASKPASKPASSPASKPDPRGQHNSGSKSTGHPPKAGVTETEQTEDYHKAREWKGLFRD